MGMRRTTSPEKSASLVSRITKSGTTGLASRNKKVKTMSQRGAPRAASQDMQWVQMRARTTACITPSQKNMKVQGSPWG